MIKDNEILWKHGSSKLEIFSGSGKNLVTIFFYANKYIIQLGETASGKVTTSKVAKSMILSLSRKYKFTGEYRDLADFIDMYKEIKDEYKSKGIYPVMYLGKGITKDYELYKRLQGNKNKYKSIKKMIDLSE